MAYENGVQVNRYNSMLYNKERQKQKTIFNKGGMHTGDYETFVNMYENSYWYMRYQSLDRWNRQHKVYWHQPHRNGRRKVAKWQSNMISRAAVRKLKTLCMEDLEDVPTMTRKQEKRSFEFWWTVY